MQKLTIAVALFAFSTVTTGCAGIGNKRPSGGAQIQKTSNEDKTPTVLDHDTTMDGRADLGQQ